MSFYLVVKKFVITKNSVVKIQNLVVNHKSRPVKPNPDAKLACHMWPWCGGYHYCTTSFIIV